MAIEIGSIIEGKITGIVDYGAFVELPEGCTGLVHISQIADKFVKNIQEFVKVGDVVKVKVLGTVKDKKYDLSMKQANPSVKSARKEAPQSGTFEDKIKRFLKESEERLLDLKKNLEYKQGGGKRSKKPK